MYRERERTNKKKRLAVPRDAPAAPRRPHADILGEGPDLLAAHLVPQKCTSNGIRRQGTVLKHRSSLQKSLCPVAICPYLCSSEFPNHQPSSAAPSRASQKYTSCAGYTIISTTYVSKKNCVFPIPIASVVFCFKRIYVM